MTDLNSSGDNPSCCTVTPREMRLQLEKVLRSRALSSSAILRKLLKYVAEKAIEGHSSEIKEYVIGREVLGRRADFDPRIDTSVRVDAHRLREKLKEYYRHEGVADEIYLELPKGCYVPRFSRRNVRTSSFDPSPETEAGATESMESPASAGSGEPSGSIFSASRGNRGKPANRKRVFLAAAAAILLISIGLLLERNVVMDMTVSRAGSAVDGSVDSEGDGTLRNLWAPFLDDKNPPIVTFSNAVFLATETSDLLRLKAEGVDAMGAAATPGLARRLVANPSLLSHAGNVWFEDVYTGTGEVMAVYYLTQMFDHFHRSIQVERSRLVSIDDLRTHDVVFLGSTREDSLLGGLPATEDFVFTWPSKSRGVWDGKIVDLHPLPGQPSAYEVERDARTGIVQAAYALVSVLPGIAPGRKVIVLGGLTTLGTQGAAALATSSTGVGELLTRLGIKSPAALDRRAPYFQAVLKVSVMKGEVLSTHCVAAHIIRSGSSASAQAGS